MSFQDKHAGQSNTPSFAQSYLRHVALGEGCGCAESVIRYLRGDVSRNEPVTGILIRRLYRRSPASDNKRDNKDG